VWGPATSGGGGGGGLTADQDTKLTQIHEAMPFIGNVVPA
jgi:hypothetical protein